MKHASTATPPRTSGSSRPAVAGSWAFTANDIPLGIDMLDRARDRYPFYDMQTLFPFTESGIADAISAAIEMRSVKSTIVPTPDLIDD